MKDEQRKELIDRIIKNEFRSIKMDDIRYSDRFNALSKLPDWELEVEDMYSKGFPEGTTMEQWQSYFIQCHAHEHSMKQKEINFDTVCHYLKKNVEKFSAEWKENPSLMASDFEKNMKSELDMSRSCDAPNKPDYYRANND